MMYWTPAWYMSGSPENGEQFLYCHSKVYSHTSSKMITDNVNNNFQTIAKYKVTNSRQVYVCWLKYSSRNFVWLLLLFGSCAVSKILTSVKVLILGFQPTHVIVGMRDYVEVGVTLLDRMAWLKQNKHNTNGWYYQLKKLSIKIILPNLIPPQTRIYCSLRYHHSILLITRKPRVLINSSSTSFQIFVSIMLNQGTTVR